jgi:hypothetical protein
MNPIDHISTEELEKELAKRKASVVPTETTDPSIAAALARAKAFPLKMRSKNGTNRINYSDLERWIKQVFGKEFCFVSTVECGNDTTHDFEDLGEHPDWLDASEISEVNEWLYGNGKAPRYSAQNLMEVLVLQGFLEKGDYLVEVSW